MRNPLLLLVLMLACAPALAAPAVKVRPDSGSSGAEATPGHWFDLIIRVDPQGSAIAEDGLEATPLPVEGVEFGAAIYPAPDAKDGFTKPFDVRVPLKVAREGAKKVSVAIKGATAEGAFEMAGEADLRLLAFDLHLEPTVALKAPAVAGRANAVVVKAKVSDGYHVYGEGADGEGLPLVAQLLPAPGARGATPWTGGGPVSPPGKKYEGTLTLEVPFTPTRAGRTELRVLVDWQACDENYCDPTALLYLPLAFDVEGASAADSSGSTSPPDVKAPLSPAGTEPAAGATSGAQSSDEYSSKSIWELIALAVTAGIVALLMPCTYPLIPITVSFFTKQADASHKSVVPLALAYGAGIVAIFTAIGALVGSAAIGSETILNLAADWPINLVFALLFLAFGLSLLGLYDIRLPSFFDDLAAKASGTGGYVSVFVMGLTLVITSFTCTVPFIGGLLVYATKDGQFSRAVLAMAVFGLTMAIPFVLLSLSPKGFQALPKSGEWMKRLKVTLGIIELGLVLKFVSNVDIALSKFLIGRELFLTLWAASFLLAGLYLLGFFDLFAKGVRWSLGKGRAVAAILLLALTAVLGYGATGAGLDTVLGEDVGSTLESFLPQFKPDYSRAFLAVAHDYEEGVRLAEEKGANIFLHFTGYT